MSRRFLAALAALTCGVLLCCCLVRLQATPTVKEDKEPATKATPGKHFFGTTTPGKVEGRYKKMRLAKGSNLTVPIKKNSITDDTDNTDKEIFCILIRVIRVIRGKN